MHLRNIYTWFLTILVLCSATITASAKDFVVVIDPGHGGNDPGAGYYGVKEKNVNLSVAKLLNQKINAADNGIKTIMTRDKDVFVKIGDRAAIANRVNADLFISIHCNALQNKSRGIGASVLVMNEKQMTDLGLKYDEETRIARLENFDRSLKMSEYVLDELVNTAHRALFLKGVSQNKRDLGVIRECLSPSIIVELDFLSNEQTCNFLKSKDGQEELATALYNSIIKYKDYIYKLDGIEDDIETTDIVAEQPDDSENYHEHKSKIVYSVQFMSSPYKIDENDDAIKSLKKYNCTYYTESGKYKYKYVAGQYDNIKEAKKLLEKIKKQYHDAFIIKMQNGKRIYNN